jgi:hypothetical protein
MNTATANRGFMAELPGWAARGVVCALPSAVWAWLIGYKQPVHVAAMATGVLTYVMIFSWACARWKGERWVEALQYAPWLKGALAVIGVGAWLGFAPFGMARGNSNLSGWIAGAVGFGSTVMVDMWTGLLAIKAGALVAPMNGAIDSIAPRGNLFIVYGATLLVTLAQGVFVSIQIGVIASMIALWLFLREVKQWSPKYC